jgi:hypothetical protein
VITKSRAGNCGGVIRAKMSGTESQLTVAGATDCALSGERRASAARSKHGIVFTEGEVSTARFPVFYIITMVGIEVARNWAHVSAAISAWRRERPG